jgi:predicted transposase YbfD/YdcC
MILNIQSNWEMSMARHRCNLNFWAIGCRPTSTTTNQPTPLHTRQSLLWLSIAKSANDFSKHINLIWSLCNFLSEQSVFQNRYGRRRKPNWSLKACSANKTSLDDVLLGHVGLLQTYLLAGCGRRSEDGLPIGPGEHHKTHMEHQ